MVVPTGRISIPTGRRRRSRFTHEPRLPPREMDEPYDSRPNVAICACSGRLGAACSRTRLVPPVSRDEGIVESKCPQAWWPDSHTTRVASHGPRRFGRGNGAGAKARLTRTRGLSGSSPPPPTGRRHTPSPGQAETARAADARRRRGRRERRRARRKGWVKAFSLTSRCGWPYGATDPVTEEAAPGVT